MNLEQDGRILYVTSVDLSLSDGPGVNEREFVLALGKRLGSRASFVVPWVADEWVASELASFDMTYTRSYNRNPFSYLLHLIDKASKVEAVLGRGSYDLLVFRLSPFPVVEWLIDRRHSGQPYAIKTLGGAVTTDLDTEGGKSRPSLRERSVTQLDRLLLKTVVRGAVGVDACTPQLRRKHLDDYHLDEDGVLLIQNATNTERFKPVARDVARRQTGLQRFDPIIGYVGGRPWIRGGRQMLDLLPRLMGRFPSVGVVIVGGGLGVQELKDKASEMGVSDRCVFFGAAPYDRVPWFVNSFDVGFAFDDPKRAEIVGNSSQKIRQYLSCGRPVMAGMGGNPFLVEEQLGFLVDMSDRDSVEEATVLLLSLTPDEKIEFSERASSYAREHLSMARAVTSRLEFWSARLRLNSRQLTRIWREPSMGNFG